MAENRIKEIEEDAFSSLKNLKQSGNQLTSMDANLLSELKSIYQTRIDIVFKETLKKYPEKKS